MDCCNYGEYRHAHGQYAGAAWDGYGYTLPYAPYAHSYYAPHAHDPYARYYRYDYPATHTHHNEHAMPMDYGAYSAKETRVRRTLSRRDQRTHPPAHHMPLPHTSSSECGMNGRGAGYCEPQMWPHYQMGVMGGGGWNGATGGAWASRSMCAREQVRYMPSDCRMVKNVKRKGNRSFELPLDSLHNISESISSEEIKESSQKKLIMADLWPHISSNTQLSHPNPLCPPNGRSTPFALYEDVPYTSENGKQSAAIEVSARSVTRAEIARPVRERVVTETRSAPPEEKRPPVVPLPAFQQAFGSTEIGKFAEAFSRAEVAHEVEDISNENFVFESFQDWEASDAQWSSPPANREIKCEENY